MKVMLQAKEIYEGNLILVNRNHPLHSFEKVKKLSAPLIKRPDIQLEKEAGRKLAKLLSGLLGSEKITGVSGYRSLEEQTEIFKRSLSENGREFTETYVAVPNHSEHQTGLAIDLAKDAPEIDFICPEFPYDGICQRFREQASCYGFIQRYPKEKEHITGIGAEPWHFRYIGTPHAWILEEQGLVLEEYIEWIKQFSREQPLRTEEEEIYYVKTEDAQKGLEISNSRTCSISGNNVDGFIVTLAGA